MNGTAAASIAVDKLVARAMQAWRPPSRLSLSEWADRYFRLSSETAAEPGRWHTLPYQRGILDAITDPDVTHVTVMKSARVGFTLMVSAAIGYFMEHEPSSILVVQPTVDDAKGFSKETIAPMLRDVPVLARLAVSDQEEDEPRKPRRRGRRRGRGPKESGATLTHKTFPGGVLSLVGANSGAGFRRISRRVVIFDEVDAYPPSAGSEGDPISLGTKRSEHFYNRKIIAGSTPLIEGTSRIEEMFKAGDQRRYYVPCPQCGHMDVLVFKRGEDGRGHSLRWHDGEPEGAFFVCSANGCVIEHHHKREMVERGEWRADRPGGRRRSFAIWAAYSYSPNATWADIAVDFLEANRGGPAKLQTYVNTTLGQTWKVIGEAPDWEPLYARRELYPIGTVPTADAIVLTCGVDVQRDRFVYEVVAWSQAKESWLVDAGVLYGDTALEATWGQLDKLLDRTFPGLDDREHPIGMLAIDSGYNTQQVYGWARTKPMSRVIACKGVQTERSLVGAPSTVEVTSGGRNIRRGYRVWPVGVALAKSELYGWLRLRVAEGQEPPPGYCHFPQIGEEYFRQLTAEHLVTRRTRKGAVIHEWQILPGRENHHLDARVLARAAANVLGIDRMKRKPARPRPTTPRSATTSPESATTSRPSPAIPAPSPRPEPRANTPTAKPAKPSWLSKGARPGRGGGGWLSKRR